MNITAKQASVLRVFEGNGELTIRQISDRSGIHKNSVETFIYGLLKKGYVVRGRDVKAGQSRKTAFTYKKKHNIDDEIEVLKGSTPVYRFVPYKQNQIAVEHQVPQKAKTTHVLPDKRNGKHEGVYLAQSKYVRQNRKHHTEVMRNNSTLNRI